MSSQETAAPPRTPARMFWTLLKVGAFVLGGGYTMIPVLQTEFVDKMRWMDEREFMDAVALAQSAPGAMVINLSVYLGYQMFGIRGVLLGLLATSLPAIAITFLIATFITQLQSKFVFIERAFRAIGPVVAGCIFASAAKMIQALDTKWLPALLLAATVLVVAVLKISPIFCIVGGGIIGLIAMRERGRRDV